MAASATSRSRPGPINVHEPGDYPIVLGDSLKDVDHASSQLMQLRYNWQPKNGFHGQKGNLKESSDDLKLIYQDEESSSTSYAYTGHSSSAGTNKGGSKMSRLVLVFDESQSAFVLEKISKSVDLNLTSAFDQSKEDIKKHRKLRKPVPGEDSIGINSHKAQNSDEEDAVDPSNPYDFRHFLAEAKESVEKASQHGARTPIPGNHTPTSSIASPSLAAGRFANTPTFRPTPVTGTSRQKPIPAENGLRSTVQVTKKPPPAKRKEATSSKLPTTKKLSKDRVSDSDDDDNDTITVARTAPKEHGRNISSGSLGRSPHIVINDGELEVDMGSPPLPVKRGPRIDPKAFLSHSHTPVMGSTSNVKKLPPRSINNEDIEMKDRHDSEDDGENENLGADTADEDDDVDEFKLGSPQHDRDTDLTEQIEAALTPTAPLPRTQEEDKYEDDEYFANELLNALEDDNDDDDDQTSRAGNPRSEAPATSNGYGHVDDDESEVSEEE